MSAETFLTDRAQTDRQTDTQRQRDRAPVSVETVRGVERDVTPTLQQDNCNQRPRPLAHSHNAPPGYQHTINISSHTRPTSDHRTSLKRPTHADKMPTHLMDVNYTQTMHPTCIYREVSNRNLYTCCFSASGYIMAILYYYYA